MGSTAAGLLTLLFLIAPGLLFDALQQRRRPGQSESAFRETNRVLLSGVLFTSVTMMLLVGVRAFLPDLFPDPGEWLRHPVKYVRREYATIAAFAGTQLIVSLLLAIGAHFLLVHKSRARIEAVASWFYTFRTACPPGTSPGVRVTLDDGTVFVGKVYSYTPTDAPVAERELVLGPPLWIKRPGAPVAPLEPDRQRVLLIGDRIRSITVSYWNDDDAPEPAAA
jgi:hypothetical protein